ncbi:MAG: CaiB/BaiF CoA transferase family protein [Alphaproteobacteria bacterium]|jgi:crotonobetainyl-CoA:carnitine CoA-transferase CaiB-like acyl-CoA transferase
MTQATAGTQPFTGIRILDFTQVLAGPYASYQLALLGADVIKVEKPGGEETRNSNGFTGPKGETTSAIFASANGNKRGICLDLKQPEAIQAVKRLAKDVDVVMENFRPGVMDRLGIGYDVLRAINPNLIYAAVSGFGREGPDAKTPAYDGKIQAISGIMSVTGHPEMGPTRAGFAVVDAAAGMTAAFAVASALFQRVATGTGQLVDISMLDTALSFLSPTVADWTVGGYRPVQIGNMAISRRPTADLFQAQDGHFLLACNTDGQWDALIKTIGREDLFEDPRFADWDTRKEHTSALRDILNEAFSSATANEWDEQLNRAGCPCSRIWDIPEVVEHPQHAYRPSGMQTIEGLKLMGTGFAFEHGGPKLETLAPAPGEHTEEVLRDAGFSDAEIAALN